MSTFLNELSTNIESDWSEVDLLIGKARIYRDNDTDFYNALCRSITVLNIAHLEGFTKSLLRAIVHDLNRNSDFSELPIAIKRTYCTKYLGSNFLKVDKRFEYKINILIEKFNELNCQIEYEPFYISKNKNPNPHLIKTVFENLGIRNIFTNLNKSNFEFIFSSSAVELVEQIEKIKEYTNSNIANFPYDIQKLSGKIF